MNSYEVIELLTSKSIINAAALVIGILLIYFTVKINNYLWRKKLLKTGTAKYDIIKTTGEVYFYIIRVNDIKYYLDEILKDCNTTIDIINNKSIINAIKTRVEAIKSITE